jgi:ribonuclease VapC
MFLDASALVAMLTNEAEGERLARDLQSADECLTSAIAIYETVARLMSKTNLAGAAAREIVANFLETAAVRTVSIGASEANAALLAFERFGKGRHPAGLNMGDCFAYACARNNHVRLLYFGDDFSLTDVNASFPSAR